MPAVTKRSLDEHLRLRRTVFRYVHLRGYTQRKAGELIGITQARVSQILGEAIADFKERVRERMIERPEEKLTRRLEQYQDLREEAFDAWELSKSDAEKTTEERQLKTVYKMVFDESLGQETRVPAGEKLKVVKVVKLVEGRCPDNAYLGTIAKCLAEESKLEGLIEETIVKVMNNNVGGNQTNISLSWDSLMERPTAEDSVERLIATVGELPQLTEGDTFLDVGKVLPVTEQPMAGWTPEEAAELDDQPDIEEHLNGDGK